MGKKMDNGDADNDVVVRTTGTEDGQPTTLRKLLDSEHVAALTSMCIEMTKQETTDVQVAQAILLLRTAVIAHLCATHVAAPLEFTEQKSFTLDVLLNLVSDLYHFSADDAESVRRHFKPDVQTGPPPPTPRNRMH